MELDTAGTVLPELVACPERGCGVPAGVTGRFVLASTDGPVEHVRTWCLEGHGVHPNPGPSWLPPDLERLRDFHLPAPA